MSSHQKTLIQTNLGPFTTIWHRTDRREPTILIPLSVDQTTQLNAVGLQGWRAYEVRLEMIQAALTSENGLTQKHRKVPLGNGNIAHLDTTLIIYGENATIAVSVKNVGTQQTANLRLEVPSDMLKSMSGHSVAQVHMLQLQGMVTFLHGAKDPKLQALYKGLMDKLAETHACLVEYDRANKTPSTDAKSEEKVEEPQPANATDAKSEEKAAAPTPQQGGNKLAPPPSKQERGAKLAPPPNPQGGGKSVDKKPTKPAVDTTPRTMQHQLASLAAKLPQEPKAPVEPPAATKEAPAAPEQVVTQTEEAPVAPVTPES
jgi:hypothetical protein